MKIPALLVCAALAVPFAAVAQSNMPPSKSPQISIQAQHFLTVLASEDQSEIDLAHLALKKSNNPQVQQYAKSNFDLIVVAAEAKEAKNPQVKAFAQKEETPVRQAAQSAKQIAQSMGA